MTYKKQLQELLKKYNELSKERRLLLSYSSVFIEFFEASIKPRSRYTAHKNGNYHFIPSPVSSTINNIRFAKRYLEERDIHQPKFLDAGCGIGNIILLANLLEFDASGVEINTRNVKIAEQIARQRTCCSLNDLNVIKGDILTFKHYSKYDVIYFYCPLSDPEKERKFEAKIANDIKVGALVIGILAKGRFTEDKRFEKANNKYPIWVKTNG